MSTVEQGRQLILSYFIENMELKQERYVMSVCEFISSIALQTISAALERELLQFDANIGNSGCEAHAFHVLKAVKTEGLARECQELKEKFTALSQALAARRSQKSGKQYFKDFFRDTIGKIEASEKFGFLMQARVLTITKKIVTNSDGYDSWETSHDNLLQCAKKIDSDAIKTRRFSAVSPF